MGSVRGITALFFPCSHGVGFGYIGRALLIAEELRFAGCRCVFASDTTERLITRCRFEVCAPDTRHGTSVPDMPERRGEYIPFDNLDSVFGMMRYYHAARIRAHVTEDLDVIDAVHPHLVFVDMHPTGAIAARYRRIPVVSVADGDFLRHDLNSWMPWVAPGTVKMPYPSCTPAFNQVLSELQLEPIRHVSDVLWGTLTLLASTPELESPLPPLNVRGALEYVGPMYWDPPWSNVADTLSEHGRMAARRIYVTMGHGGKVVAEQIQRILDGCVHQDWAVFVSLGFRALDTTVTLPANARAGEFTGLSHPLEWCDVVINHGGYATVLASLQFGRPSIIIPFMSEQEANGRLFVEGSGAGFVLRRTEPAAADSGRRFQFEFRYSGRRSDGTVTAEEIRRGLQEIFAEPRYAERSASVGTRLKAIVAERSFVRLVEHLC
jgi:UDP:flavonoid glycosyltransferase YjiC (YdhE family)